MRFTKLFILALCTFLFSSPLLAASPMTTVKKVYRLLYNYNEHSKSASRQKKKINGYFMLSSMARGAIRDHWSKMRRRQKREYMRLMIRLLEKAVYQDTHENLQKGKVTFKKQRILSRKRSTVFTTIYIKDEDMNIDNDFKMRKVGSVWKTQDLYVDGASLTEDYRSQFNKIISQYGMDRKKDSLFFRLRKAVKQEKDEWRKSWKSKKNKKKERKKLERPKFLEEG